MKKDAIRKRQDLPDDPTEAAAQNAEEAARAKAEALLSDLFADNHQNVVKHHVAKTKMRPPRACCGLVLRASW